MKVISVNVGQPTAVQVGNHTTISGIRKHPVPGRVQVGAQGVVGDRVLNRKHHGGPDQAVYVYTREDYDAWTDLLGRPLPEGKFGENLLISGAESAGVKIGERFQVGNVILEVSGVRVPCGTLGAVMEDAGFVKRFVQARRPGFYTRVIQGGEIGRGDDVARIPGPDGAPTIGEVFDVWYANSSERQDARLKEWLTYPLAERLRATVQSWLN
ncbi:MOSC domain-containing protein [Deinococcus fonticola]|uniref:MOSC domain-containing protein n=1 Tax=Deinococcus fonticola TaxID=2528713 RepID=UPI001074F165|nr:MOSC domain-containing protein [Deinococcus fonticola]